MIDNAFTLMAGMRGYDQMTRQRGPWLGAWRGRSREAARRVSTAASGVGKPGLLGEGSASPAVLRYHRPARYPARNWELSLGV